ncbi:MAG: hypothetical protein C0518_16140 [Opitutus sp.]|nr:hypothetical protein [Opitutus sp.]
MQRFQVIGLVLASLGIATGNVSCAQKAAAKHGDYVTYYPTGSNLPVRVKQTDLETSDEEQAAQKRALRDAQYSGQRLRKDN